MGKGARKLGVALGLLANGAIYLFFGLVSQELSPVVIWGKAWGQADEMFWVFGATFALCLLGLTGALAGLRWPTLSATLLGISVAGPLLMGFAMLAEVGEEAFFGLLLFMGLPTAALVTASLLVGRKIPAREPRPNVEGK